MSEDKALLLSELIARVDAELARGVDGHRSVQAGATHEEARPENDKDTRALEASYLARGLAERVAQQEATARLLRRLVLRPFGADDPIALGALVTLTDDDSGNQRRYFVVPAAGGERLMLGQDPVLTVTPDAPLGRSLLGAVLGDEVTIRTPRGPVAMEVSALA